MIRSDEEVERLVNENQEIAVSFSKKNDYDFDESTLLSLAYDGLLIAARTWDASSCPFRPYAYMKIKYRVGDERKFIKRKIRGGRVSHLSIDAPMSEGSDAGTFGDVIPDEAMSSADQVAEQKEVSEEALGIESLISKLDERKATIIRRRFGIGCEPKKLEEIAAEIRCTGSRVKQLVDEAIEALAKIRKKEQKKASDDALTLSKAIKTGLALGKATPASRMDQKTREGASSKQKLRGFYRKHRLDDLDRVITSGATLREISRLMGMHRDTVNKRKKHLMALGVIIRRCGCGRLAGHKGWCSHLFQRSEKRQLVMKRLTAKRSISSLPSQPAPTLSEPVGPEIRNN